MQVRTMIRGRVVMISFAAALSAISATMGATPGRYYGTTSQGLWMRLTVSDDGTTVTFFEIATGCFYRQGVRSGYPYAPIQNDSFIYALGPGVGICTSPNFQFWGIFYDEVHVTGRFDYHEGDANDQQCCSGYIPWSACLTSPNSTPDLTLTRSGSDTLLSWTNVSAEYDVVRGSLDTLRSTGGDFSASIDGCAAEDLASTSLILSDSAGGESLFFLVRPSDCTGLGLNGSYETSDPAQAGSRDAEINSSPLSCQD